MAVLVIQGAVVYYIGRTLVSQAARLMELPLFGAGFLFTLAAVSALYSVPLILAALGWTGLVGGFSNRSVSWRDGLWIYGQTVTAKYLPGNVFHFVGRQLLGMRLGWSQSAIALATLVEAIMLLSAAAGFALLAALWTDVPALFGLPPGIYFTAAAAAAGLPWLLIAAGRFRVTRGILKRLPLGATQIGLRPCLRTFLVLLLFLLTSMVLIWAIVAALSGRLLWADLSAILGCYGFIFLAGYVLPGAPAGLGVREAMLILVLGPVVGVNVATAGALSFRVATVTGEVLFFFATMRLRPPPQVTAS
jgi:hypothetical protein